MHGGKASGAPKGNQNALKHGNYTAAAQAALREKKRETRRILEIEQRKFREVPEEWADRASLRGSVGANTRTVPRRRAIDKMTRGSPARPLTK